MTLPNLFVVGAAKSGTTSLYKVLSNHSQIFEPLIKEPFFYTNYNQPPQISDKELSKIIINDYKRYNEIYKSADAFKIIPDYSTTYLYEPEKFVKNLTAERGDISETKIIVILRHPVNRVHSHFKMLKQNGLEDLNFEEAIDLKNCNLRSKIRWGYDYRGFSQYKKQLEVLNKHFKKTNILVLNFDILKSNPKLIYEDIYEFLNIKQEQHNTKTNANKSINLDNQKLASLIRTTSKCLAPLKQVKYIYKPLIKIKILLMNKMSKPAAEIPTEQFKELSDYFSQDIAYLKENYSGFESW